MLLVAHLLSHPPFVYTLSTPKTYVYAWVVSLIILLPQLTHNQHQNMNVCIGSEPQHSSTMNYTLSHSKQSKPKSLSKIKNFHPNFVFKPSLFTMGGGVC
jgi:hypothetical protein